ncbi:hypothetical protein N866_07185 [Actinotalea ferrariae CF5-4]|uniref:Uncharacterized protein n=1 Tax=Actinotalea ferrariae CF5-4 TaxID=948458 RepID=A0A021VU20_9CELL|nr:hypothetical protein [Actinotalea ferrariae]EYR64651.1 hypothetical protein N866_07185 [Actinotalea ferrariae CF5-4]
MVATPMPTTERFFAPEISKVYIATTMADYTQPTRVELNASTDVTAEIAGVTGWSVTSAMIVTPDWGSRFTRQIGGRTSAEASSITFYADLEGQDIRTILARGDKVKVVFADQGDVAGLPADIFDTEVTSLGKVRTNADGALTITVNFAIKSVPAEDVPLPAAA